MNTILLCSHLSTLDGLLRTAPGPFDFINLLDDSEGRSISANLSENPDAHELPRAALLREHKTEIRKKYLGFMAGLNQRNHSIQWWAMHFTDKYPLASSFTRNFAFFLLIVTVVREYSGRLSGSLMVITDSPDLAAQVTAWAKTEGVAVRNAVKRGRYLNYLLRTYTPAGILCAGVRTFLYWALSIRLKPTTYKMDGHLVITAPVRLSAFSGPTGYRDSFFGPLIEHIAKSQDKALVFVLPLERPLDVLGKLKTIKSSPQVLPVEAYLTLRDLAACLLQSLKIFIRLPAVNGPLAVDGIDLSCLVNLATKEARNSGNLFMNLRMYYWGKRLAQTIRIDRFLYPYESLVWERMFISGMRSVSPGTRLAGYQHACVSQAHTNFIFGEGEAEITPLPDVIFTTGKVIQKKLEFEGNYPEGIFKTACALRQGQRPQSTPKERKPQLTNVLVALARDYYEYVATITFLEQAKIEDFGYELRLRPHPDFSLEIGVEMAQPSRRDFFSTSTGTLDEDLEWADVVLYSSSTVAMEAISMGIPAISLDLGDYLDNDPMFGWADLKWQADEPSQLVETLHSIEKVPPDQFRELQHRGQEYVTGYFAPVTEAGLQVFLKD